MWGWGGKLSWKFLFCGERALGGEKRAAGGRQLPLPTGQDRGSAQSLTDTGALGEAGGFSSLEDSEIPYGFRDSLRIL